MLVSALDRVALVCAHQESGDDEVALTNGDRIVGELLAIMPKLVILESGATGPLKISRKVVRSVAFSRGRSVLIKSSFEQDRMDPWIPVLDGGDNWMMSDGSLVCHSSGSRQRIYAELDQEEAVTYR